MPEIHHDTDDEPTELDMVQDAAELAYAVWRRTDFDAIDTHRNIDDEFGDKIRAAAYTDTVASFMDRLATRWGVRSYHDGESDVRGIIHRYDGADGPSARQFLRTARNNNRLVVLEMQHEYMSDGDTEDSA